MRTSEGICELSSTTTTTTTGNDESDGIVDKYEMRLLPQYGRRDSAKTRLKLGTRSRTLLLNNKVKPSAASVRNKFSTEQMVKRPTQPTPSFFARSKEKKWRAHSPCFSETNSSIAANNASCCLKSRGLTTPSLQFLRAHEGGGGIIVIRRDLPTPSLASEAPETSASLAILGRQLF